MAAKTQPSSEYPAVMLYIANDLTEDDVKRAKYYLRTTVSNSEIEKIHSGLDLMKVLESKELLSMNDTKYFENMLQSIGCKYLVERLAGIKRVSAEAKSVSKRVETMSVVPYFIETRMCGILKNRLKEQKLVIIRDIAASGKSQLTYWYAENFHMENPSSIIFKLKCTTPDDLMQSMTKLLDLLWMKFETHETEKDEYIRQMGLMIRDKLCSENFKEFKNVLIFDDIEKPCYQIVKELLALFQKENCFIILGTTVNSVLYSKEFDSDSFLKMERLTSDESLRFFAISEESSEKYETSEKDDIIRLASELDNLPFSLVCANSYMRKTGIPAKEYLWRLKRGQFLEHVEKCLKDENCDYNKGLVATQKMSLENIAEKLEQRAVELLKLIPFLVHDKIHVSILRLLLSDQYDSDERREDMIDSIIAGFRDYSLCVLHGSGNDRKVSLHAVTSLVLMSLQTDDEQEKNIQRLAYLYTCHMSLDARHSSVLSKNLMLQVHAIYLVRKMENLFKEKNKDIQTRIIMSYIITAIGVTFRLHGLEDLLADEYLKKARFDLFHLAGVDHTKYSINTYVNVTFSSEKLYDQDTANLQPVTEESEGWFKTALNHMQKVLLRSESSSQMSPITRESNPKKTKFDEKEMAEILAVSDLFDKLHQIGDSIPTDFLRELILHTARSDHDLVQIMSVAKLHSSESEVRKNGRLTPSIYQQLLNMGLGMPLEELKKIFLVELMTIVLYNSGRNLYQWKPHDKFAIAHCCYDLRLSYLLGQKLKKQSPQFVSVQCLITARNGLLYHLLIEFASSETHEMIKPLLKAINRFEGILSDSYRLKYFEFGILKVSDFHNSHNTGMCLQHLLSCYSKLYGLYESVEKKDEVYKKGTTCVEKLENVINSACMQGWVAVPGFHVHIGKFYVTTSQNNKLALAHFSKAIQCQKEYKIFGLSHTYLQAAFGLVKCCLDLADEESLGKGKIMCTELINSLHSSNHQESLKKARDELQRIITLQQSQGFA